MICLNCARKTVAPRTVDKYNGLTRYLKFRGSFTNVVKLSFARIDGSIGDNLPMSAYKAESWWSNLPSNVHARGWLDAGWIVKEVNLKEGYVVFQKVKQVQLKTHKKEAYSRQIKKPFTPAPVRIPRRKEPSKTKMSKLYARVKNLERQRTSMPQYHGSFKPKPRYEKRMLKQKEKPE